VVAVRFDRVPQLAASVLQVTAVFVVPETVAVISTLPLVNMLLLEGVTCTLTVSDAPTDTEACADLVGSAWLVTVMIALHVPEEGAV
jgi:hypothetical protein